ncbi:hypothetical protein [Salinarchaeum sp. Harcht-Bsk1]|uniref:hypothetical protein n=1 Tax=Salinarchaeum sp. Harcht-Bsk1 TaxID=1333523 RepID=UPI001181BA31|nr:hypothetical protein [Salinarchaeum sp. Harcht-Bsk1]
MNGNDPVTPFKRQYISTGAAFLVIILYNVGSALYNIGCAIILDGGAHVFNAVRAIASDLWHARPSFTRWALRGVEKTAKFSASLIVATAAFLIEILR